MYEARHGLARLFRAPREVRSLSLSDWDLAIRQARAAGMLARLHYVLSQGGVLAEVPAAPREHLVAAQIVWEKHARDTRWEVECIRRALAGIVDRLVLLKGAAYLMAELPPAYGRVFGDVDILVPEEKLVAVEMALRRAGWAFGEVSDYDNRYYRRWMHQIPPLLHGDRETGIDVHHTLVARTTRIKLNPHALLDAARPIPADSGIHVLSPADMVLHSATHLLNEGNFNRGFRDLDDLNLLLHHFGRDPEFFPTLVERAAKLDLRRPLFYALRYTAMLMETPVPSEMRDSEQLAPPNAALRHLMDALFERALRPDHPSSRDPLSRPAMLLLYIRAHHLLMPGYILVPHLLRKAIVRRFPDE
jgi:hypothetical protein